MSRIGASKNILIYDDSPAAATNTASPNDKTLTALVKPRWVGLVTLQMISAANTGASTLDVDITCSLDGGTTYSVLVSFTQIGSGGAGNEIKQVAIPIGALLKSDINMGSATTCDVTIYASGMVEGGSGD